MSRVTVFAVSVALFRIVPSASGENDHTFILMSGQTSDNVTYFVRTQAVGSPQPTGPGGDCFGGAFQAGVVGLEVRDALVPENGLSGALGFCGFGTGTPNVKRTRVNGVPAADIFFGGNPSTIWVSTDNSSTWTLLEPTVPVTLHGVTFTSLESGLGSIAGNVPAVGGIGLVVLVGGLIGAGIFLMRSRSARGAK